MIAKAIRVSLSGEKAAQPGTEAPRSQVQADVAPPSLGQSFSGLPLRTAATYKKIIKPPLLESPAQSRLLADAPGNAREAPLHSRAGIPQTFWSTRGRHRVAGLAKYRWLH